MKIKLKIEKEFDVRKLKVQAGARYCEDATVDGLEDIEGNLMPFLVDVIKHDSYYSGTWCPVIDIESGIIEDWPIGKIAFVHYKCCDDGLYQLIDENDNIITSIDGYVPDIMCPRGEGYGDYIIMHIDGNGKIDNFNNCLKEFNSEDND